MIYSDLYNRNDGASTNSDNGKQIRPSLNVLVGNFWVKLGLLQPLGQLGILVRSFGLKTLEVSVGHLFASGEWLLHIYITHHTFTHGTGVEFVQLIPRIKIKKKSKKLKCKGNGDSSRRQNTSSERRSIQVTPNKFGGFWIQIGDNT